jgi:hypothetical protein
MGKSYEGKVPELATKANARMRRSGLGYMLGSM